MTVLYIDADACPVRQEALRVAARHGAAVKVVCNGGIRPDPDPLVETVMVADGPDAADDWIAERIGRGDVCVTADIPLAARCVARGARVVKPDGETLSDANVGAALATRNLMADLRSANPMLSMGGGRLFSKQDRARFLDRLETVMRAAAKEAG